MSLPSRDKIYGNCSVLHPDGTLMFRCDTDRIDWYLERNLAVVVNETPMTIQLTFTPRGKGHIGEPFYLSEKVNRCVVCGGFDDLTRHHAVPHCYRRFFPDALKSRTSHDVLPVCIDCHESYETEAQRLKKQIALDMGLPVNAGGKVDDSPARAYHKAKSSANALSRYADRIPEHRKQFLLENISEYGGHPATPEDVQRIAAIPNRRARWGKPFAGEDGEEGVFSHGKAVVDKLTDFDAFIVMWRQHFVDTMNPQYLHKDWDVNHRVRKWVESQNEDGTRAQATNWIARFVGWNPLQQLRRLVSASPKVADTNTPQDT